GTFAHVRQVRTKVDEWKKKSLKTGEAGRLAKQALDGAVCVRDQQALTTEKARADRQSIIFNAPLHDVLEPLLVDASRAQTIDSEVAKRTKAVEKARDVARAAQRAALEVEQQVHDKRSEMLEQQRQLNELEHRLEHARMSNMASELRETLQPGEACPV